MGVLVLLTVPEAQAAAQTARWNGGHLSARVYPPSKLPTDFEASQAAAASTSSSASG